MNKTFLIFFALILAGMHFPSLIASAHTKNSQPSALAQLKAKFTIPNKDTIESIKNLASLSSLNEMVIIQYDKVEELLSNHAFSERYQADLYKNELFCTAMIIVRTIIKIEQPDNIDSQKK